VKEFLVKNWENVRVGMSGYRTGMARKKPDRPNPNIYMIKHIHKHTYIYYSPANPRI